MTIIIDTREQTPWNLASFGCDVKVAKLDAGDYALEGDAGFAIERKSLNDFLGTVSSGWDRFRREIGRMASFVAKPIVVETDFASFCHSEVDGEIKPPPHPHYRLGSAFVAMRIAELTLMRCQVLFAGNTEYAAAIGYALLLQRARQISCS